MRSREECGGGWKFSAARRMKGVVRPQARPTRRKPRVQFRIEGEEGGGVEVEDILAVGVGEGRVWWKVRDRSFCGSLAGCPGKLFV